MAVLLITSGCGGSSERDKECAGASDCGDGRVCVSTAGEVGPAKCVADVSQATGAVYVDPSTNLQWQECPATETGAPARSPTSACRSTPARRRNAEAAWSIPARPAAASGRRS